MKLTLKIMAACIFLAISVGFYFRWQDQTGLGDKIIGIAVLFSSFVFLPLFLYHRWKGKRLKDYTLSEENLKKMRDQNRR